MNSKSNVVLLTDCSYAGIKIINKQDAFDELFKIPHIEVCELCKYYCDVSYIAMCSYTCLSNSLNSRGLK